MQLTKMKKLPKPLCSPWHY